jgi:hypothetical protein
MRTDKTDSRFNFQPASDRKNINSSDLSGEFFFVLVKKTLLSYPVIFESDFRNA